MISTDSTKIAELLTRGVEKVFPNEGFLKKELESGRQLTLYTGYDPTASTLHIGHGITMMKLRQFQDLGHKIIFLIGDFTGMIGDPTDKSSARQPLTREQVLANAELYTKQASAILNFSGENPVEVRYNSEWSDKLTMKDCLDLFSNFTVPRLLERDMFQARLKDGKTIYLHEFLYPVLQGYDMFAMHADGQVGGNDQTFNMLSGRELISQKENREAFVVALKLLVDDTGKKMGKSEGNMIAFTDSPEDMFGKVMRWSDGMIVGGFELCTKVSMEEIESMKVEMKNGANPRDFKLNLAHQITEMFLGSEAAKIGRDHFTQVIQANEMPAEIPELQPSAYDIITVLVEAKFAKSRTEARDTVDGGGVKINEHKIDSYDITVKSGDIIQKGKRFFVRVL